MATRTTQHRQERDTRSSAKEMTELRRENRSLRRQVLRLQRDITRFQQEVVAADEPETLATAEARQPISEACEKCGGTTKQLLLPSGKTLRVCQKCKARKTL